MTREPIVLHVARDDYQGTLCGEGEMRIAFRHLSSAERLADKYRLTMKVCDRCREAAQEEER